MTGVSVAPPQVGDLAGDPHALAFGALVQCPEASEQLVGPGAVRRLQIASQFRDVELEGGRIRRLQTRFEGVEVLLDLVEHRRGPHDAVPAGVASSM